MVWYLGVGWWGLITGGPYVHSDKQVWGDRVHYQNSIRKVDGRPTRGRPSRKRKKKLHGKSEKYLIARAK